MYKSSIGGSVVECSPATRAARVRFPADANILHSSRHKTPYLKRRGFPIIELFCALVGLSTCVALGTSVDWFPRPELTSKLTGPALGSHYPQCTTRMTLYFTMKLSVG